MTRRLTAARAFALGLVVVLALALSPSTARAHALILDISPADGTLVAASPPQLVVKFSEPIASSFIEVTFLSPTDTAPLHGSVDPTDARVLVVPLPRLPDGLHRIGFVVRDREDLHEVRGRTSFAIGDTAVATPSPPPNPGGQPFETGARWAFVTGLALLIGVVVRTALGSGKPGEPEGERLVRVGWAGATLVVVGRVGVLTARAVDLHAGVLDGLSAVARTGDMIRLPLAAVALLCIVPTMWRDAMPALDATVRDGHRLTFRRLLAWVGIVWLALIASWGDHAALLGAVEPAVALAKAAHLVGIGLWVGVLVVTLMVSRGTGATMRELHRVRRVAMVGAAVTVSAGLLLASRMIVSVTGLFATHFGQLLVVKIGVAAVAVAVALVNRLRRRGPAVFEAVLLCCGTVLLGAAMATAGPATGSAYLAAPTPPVKSVAAEVDDIIVRVHAIPAVPGANDLEMVVLQTRRPVPAPLGPTTVAVVTTHGPRTWTVDTDGRGAAVITGVDLPEGSNAITFTVTRPGLADTVLHATIVTTAPRYHHPVIVSAARLTWWWRGLALAVGLATIVLVSGRRRRPSC
ncbi:MAG: hypothetical protein RJA49_1156 [Actinomycetota bacterium]